MSTSSSSDTDEEEQQKLKESVIEFHIDTKQPLNIGSKHKVCQKKSLRNSLNEENTNVLQVTSEFKKFVAKKLESFLEDETEFFPVAVKPGEEKKISNEINGVKLLRTSVVLLNDDETESTTTSKIRKMKEYVSSSSEDDEETMARFRSAAVTAHKIIKDSCFQDSGNKDTEPESLKGAKRKKKKKKKINPE